MQVRSPQVILLYLSSLTHARLRMGSQKRTIIRSWQMSSDQIGVFFCHRTRQHRMRALSPLGVAGTDMQRPSKTTTAVKCCLLRERTLFFSSKSDLPLINFVRPRQCFGRSQPLLFSAACGCIGHPAFPAPSYFRGTFFWHSSGAICAAGMRSHTLGCLKIESVSNCSSSRTSER
jgi:hypothetical protein